MAIGSYLSIITLNVNRLNDPMKRQRLADGYKNKTSIYAVYTRDPPQNKGHIQTESEGLEKDISKETKRKQE